MNNKKVFAGGWALAFSCLLYGCAGSQKTTTSASSGPDCNYARVGAVMMRLETGSPSQVSGKNLPGNYTVFTADNEKAFFTAAKKLDGTAAIQLPSGCRRFRLSLSDAMSPEMMKRYPDLVSLKGSAADGTDLRLDWDGTSMRGQVVENGKSYLLEPHVTGIQKVYLLYSKDDVTTTPRRSFEQKQTAPPQRQRTPAADR